MTGQTHNVKVLAVCSRNRWRSPTAERLINQMPGFQARSAGTAAAARLRVNPRHISWADVIVVMEHHHARRLREQFGGALEGRRIHCLEVPDKYLQMDTELVALLQPRLNACLLQPE